MLTNEAIYQRKWGRFPSLGKLLGQQPIPSHYYGYSSVSDNVLSWLQRLAEVAVVIKEHGEKIRTTTDPTIAARLPEDLERLRSELQAASAFFLEHAELVDVLFRDAGARAGAAR